MWHDYDGGFYHVTICTANRDRYFGRITVGENGNVMELSPIGEYAVEQFRKVQQYYPYAEIPCFIVMPDHIHAIVYLSGRDAMNRVSTRGGVTGEDNPMLRNTLGAVVRGLKARITKFAHENDIPFAWQSRFYDRIIRNQVELIATAKYIEDNLVKWTDDKDDDK